MDKKTIFALALSGLAICVLLYSGSQSVGAAQPGDATDPLVSGSQSVGAAQPGDATDPLVTRRYVDARIGELAAQVSRLEAVIAGGGLPAQPAPGTPPAPGSQPAPGAGMPGQVPPPAEGAPPALSTEQLALEVLALIEARHGGALAGGEPRVVPFQIYSVPAGRRLIFEAGAEFVLRTGNVTAVTGENGFVDITGGRDVTGGETISHNHLHLVPASDGRGLQFVTNGWIMIKGGYRVAE